MVLQSLNPNLQADYRDSLGVPISESFIAETPLIPVRPIGAGIARNNTRQTVQTVSILKSAITTDYIQIVNASSTQRVWFLGALTQGQTTGAIYVEDADSGNIAFSDASTVALFWETGLVGMNYNPLVPRECKRGIRVSISNTAASNQRAIIFFMTETIP